MAQPAPPHASTSPDPRRPAVGPGRDSHSAAVPNRPATGRALVEAGTSFEGLLSFTGSSRVDGEFRGVIATAGRVELGEAARVAGRIEADEVVIAGSFTGEIVAHSRLEILPTARIDGELSTGRLVVADGSAVRATCRTVQSSKESKQSPSPP